MGKALFVKKTTETVISLGTMHPGQIRAFWAVYRGNVKYTDYAFNKTTVYKRKSCNHLADQIESFRIGDKDNKREDDLLDTFCYGIALPLGDGSGF
jgi:hypothetical protein